MALLIAHVKLIVLSAQLMEKTPSFRGNNVGEIMTHFYLEKER